MKSEKHYKLVWKYGDMGFFFSPRCMAEKSELLCSLQGTSSSGSLKGQYGEIELTRPEEVEPIEHNKAFWLEPDGSKVQIEIGNQR